MDSKEPDPDDHFDAENMFEPDPDDSQGGKSSNSKLYLGTHGVCQGPYTYGKAKLMECRLNRVVLKHGTAAEPDSDDMLASEAVKDETNDEPDPDDYYDPAKHLEYEKTIEPDPDDSQENNTIHAELDPDDSQENSAIHAEPDPDPDDKLGVSRFTDSFETLPPLEVLSSWMVYVSKPDIVSSDVDASGHDAVDIDASRVMPMEAAKLLGTLVKIIEEMINYRGQTVFGSLHEVKPLNVAKCSGISAAGLGRDSEWNRIEKGEIHTRREWSNSNFPWLSGPSHEACKA